MSASDSHSHIEHEIKLRLRDASEGRALLEKAGFQVRKARLLERNVVYDDAKSGLRKRGSVLRLRQADSVVILTLKGPSQPSLHKSRTESEVVVSDFQICEAILREIGYSPVFRYEKFRTEYYLPGDAGIVTLDETPVGTYLEIEGDPAWIDLQAGRLGFTEADYLTVSYGRLYVQYCQEHGLTPTDMLFLPQDSDK